MKIPYGLSNFKDIITQGYLYIDKTAYIEQLEEQGKFNILLRPRRFGKSLFLSTLWHYYDRRYSDEFDTIFSDLYISEHPTPLKNSYQVLFMQFSGINTDNAKSIEQDFAFEVTGRLRVFLECHQYPPEIIRRMEAQSSPANLMKAFFEIVRDKKIYLLIDEYDHFANTVLGNDLNLYKEIVGRGGFVRSFYETIKTATLEGIVDRFFITGVTSITLDSLTSGFNIGENISLHKNFNQALGFTAQETETVLRPLANCSSGLNTLTEDTARWYNGYLFNEEATERVFNPDMVLYFAKNFDKEECRYPKKMLDPNIASDYRKILQYFSIGDSEQNYQILEELITTGQVIAEHKGTLDIAKSFDRNDFISLIFYMGFITIQRAALDETAFSIPNHVIQRLYFEYFKVETEQRSQVSIDSSRLKEAIRELALRGDITALTEEIGKVLALLSNRDFMNMDEKHIKAIILTLLYQSTAYFIKSEPEINNRYPDILLLERNPIQVKYQILLELKYTKKSSGKHGWSQKIEEGNQQVLEYFQLEDIQRLKKLKAFLLVTDGNTVEAIEIEQPPPTSL
ncbi:MAG: AAA family ATPase [Candidatus Electrothrix sp. MAN1_4]|nr:AAA family ATPase [Candidatus Electrothrix sp. MAN1_4]